MDTTWFQEAKRRLGVSHPAEQLLRILDRVEALEKVQGVMLKNEAEEPEMTRSEKMKVAWAKKKAEKEVKA